MENFKQNKCKNTNLWFYQAFYKKKSLLQRILQNRKVLKVSEFLF